MQTGNKNPGFLPWHPLPCLQLASTNGKNACTSEQSKWAHLDFGPDHFPGMEATALIHQHNLSRASQSALNRKRAWARPHVGFLHCLWEEKGYHAENTEPMWWINVCGPWTNWVQIFETPSDSSVWLKRSLREARAELHPDFLAYHGALSTFWPYVTGEQGCLFWVFWLTYTRWTCSQDSPAVTYLILQDLITADRES